MPHKAGGLGVAGDLGCLLVGRVAREGTQNSRAYSESLRGTGRGGRLTLPGPLGQEVAGGQATIQKSSPKAHAPAPTSMSFIRPSL